MKFNLDCDIENLAYILYMEEQEEESNNDNGENQTTSWKFCEPRKAWNKKNKIKNPETHAQ